MSSLNNQLLNNPIKKKVKRDLPKLTVEQATDQEKLILLPEQEKLLRKLVYEDKLLVGRDKLHAFIMKQYPDAAISRRNVMRWLRQQPFWQQTTQGKKREDTSMRIIRKKGYYSADLKGPLPRDGGKEYIFAMCDLMSRKIFAKAIPSTSSADSVKALTEIMLENADMKITVIQTDNGGTFQSGWVNYLKEIGVKQLYSAPYSPWTNGIERLNKDIGNYLYRNQLATGSKAWVNLLPQIVENMNSTVNSSIKTTPNDVFSGGLPDDINEKRSKKYGNMKRFKNNISALKIGDMVRIKIRKKDNAFNKKQTYSTDVYVIMKVNKETNSRLVTYKLSLDGQKLEPGTWNLTELLQVYDAKDVELPELTEKEKQVGEVSIRDQVELDALLEKTPEISVIRQTRRPKADEDGNYEVEKILSKRKFGKKVKYLLKYVGYPLSESTWEEAKNIFAKDLLANFRKEERTKNKK